MPRPANISPGAMLVQLRNAIALVAVQRADTATEGLPAGVTGDRRRTVAIVLACALCLLSFRLVRLTPHSRLAGFRFRWSASTARGLVHADMVLVAVEALVVLLRPARVRVLLRILGRLLLPSLRCLAGLDRLVLLLRVALLGHRHNRGVNDLAAARNVARGLEMLAEALEQLVDQPGLRQRLAKQPDRGGIRHRLLEFQIEKAHERQPVTQDRVIGLAAGVALALLGLRLRHRLDVSAE